MCLQLQGADVPLLEDVGAVSPEAKEVEIEGLVCAHDVGMGKLMEPNSKLHEEG